MIRYAKWRKQNPLKFLNIKQDLFCIRKGNKLYLYWIRFNIIIEMQNQRLPVSNLPTTPRNDNEYYATLRRYTERLKEERDISLGYLNTINQMSEQIRLKDYEIQKLHKANKQLSEKLSLYTSVLSRSRVNKQMRMSTLIGKNKLTESIIETKQEYFDSSSIKPFEQFYIADLTEAKKGVIKYKFLYDTNNTMEETINNFLIGNQGKSWEVEPFGAASSEKNQHFELFLSNSVFTTKKTKQTRLQFLDSISPSYYYYITCMVQKEIISIGGKYFWTPIAYGFVSMLPNPDYLFRLLEEIGREIKIKNEPDIKRLASSLAELDKCPCELNIEMKYIFLSKPHLWKIPDAQNEDAFFLHFSTGVLENFALELIIDVLILLLLEIPITVISKDQLLLCKFMFYFVYIIKPLKYPFPIVFNITEKLTTLLESPFPTFTGTVNSLYVDPYLNERAVFDLDNKVAKSWPMLVHLDSSRQFLMRIAHKAGGYDKLTVVTQEIIKGHQYHELEPYWKDFSKTQIYKNFVYDN